MSSDLKLHKAYDYCKGENPKLTVIFIHGISSDSTSFSKAFECLRNASSMEDVRLVAFDLLGAGKSLTSDELDYNYDEQLLALDNSISELDIRTPIVLVGHSMGTMIVSRYIGTHDLGVRNVILISAPVYTESDLKNPVFMQGMEAFKNAVKQKSEEIFNGKCFNNELKNIVLNPDNYNYFVKLDLPTTIIYGAKDGIIASYNLPKIAKENPNVKLCQTSDGHSVSSEKSEILLKELEEIASEIV